MGARTNRRALGALFLTLAVAFAAIAVAAGVAGRWVIALAAAAIAAWFVSLALQVLRAR